MLFYDSYPQSTGDYKLEENAVGPAHSKHPFTSFQTILKIPLLRALASSRKKIFFRIPVSFYITEIPVTPSPCEYHVINHYLFINGRNFPRFVFIFRQKMVLESGTNFEEKKTWRPALRTLETDKET